MPPPTDADLTLRPIRIADWPVEVSIPTTWNEIESDCCDFRHFSGLEPEGHLSVGHESPFSTSVCSPECRQIDLPATIPYSATAQLDALKARVAAIAGSSEWTELPPDVLPQVEGGVRLETTAVDPAGREWRRVHIVGLRERNAVAIAWSQPTSRYDARLLDAVLAGLVLTPAPKYSDGDLVDPWRGEPNFTMPIPGLWLDSDQPTLDGLPLSGVRRFADGRLVVSIGDRSGTLGWCDPDCRVLTGQTSLEALERSMRQGQSLGATTSASLGGEPARAMGTDTPAMRRYVVAIHRERPVALMIDTGGWDVAPGIVEQMISGFAFVDVEPAQVDQVFSAAGGRVEIGLSGEWQQSSGDGDVFLAGTQRLTIRAGDDDGSIQTCDRPAGPWELCREVRVGSLDELAAAVQPAPIADHGVGPPSPRRDTGTLGGEPSVVTRIQAYEYPAKSGQEVVYVVTMHRGRPYILRIWTSANEVRDLESVIAGFRFVD